MKELILASKSPRRRDILKLSGFKFRVVTPDCDENIPVSSPEKYVSDLSVIKAEAAFDEISGSLENAAGTYIISADTIVYHNGTILGKPEDNNAAFEMLKELNGDRHSVYTGVTVIDINDGNIETFYEKTDVFFYDVTEKEIEEYINTKEPLDKAGAYGIQGRGAFLVKRIEGDYYNVVGLPLSHLIRVLYEMDKKYERDQAVR